MTSVVEEKTTATKLTNSDIKELYKFATILVNSKYKEPIKVLQKRNIGYSCEDFIQETMQLVLASCTSKSFDSIYKLKSFLCKTMEFHYLKEKRKYFYTKQRGSYDCISLEDTVVVESTAKCAKDVIVYEKTFNTDFFDLNNLMSKHLYIVIDNNNYIVCPSSYLSQCKTGMIISVNHFIEMQNNYGFRDSCRFYKSQGIRMTKDVYNNVSQAIINYAKEHNLLCITEDKKVAKKSVVTNPLLKTVKSPTAFSIDDLLLRQQQ